MPSGWPNCGWGAEMKREHLPPIAGTIRTRRGMHVRFQFVASGHALPYVVLSNHGLGDEGNLSWDGRQARFRFLIGPAGPDNRWQRTDVAEPVVDWADSADDVPTALRTAVHDDCLDAWEAYMDERPELLSYARLTEINNDILQLDEKAQRLEKQLAEVHGRKANLEALEARIRAAVPRQSVPLSSTEREIIEAMVTDNCWLSLREGEQAELHPFQSPDVLREVDATAARRLIVCGFVELHRYLADERSVFKIAKRGREAVEGRP